MSLSVFGLVGILTFAFCIGLSVAVTMGLGGLVVAELFNDRPVWEILGHVPWNVTTSESLVALPLFILMGEILMRTGITDRMYESLAKWLNGLPGGLLHTNIAASAMFACISGSSSATAATIGGVSLPAMKARNYDERTALGSLAAGGTLGILIPPSITFIVYAVLVEESIGQLYIAAIIPGLIMTLSFMAVILVKAKLDPSIAPALPSVPFAEKLRSLVSLVPIGILMFLVLGTIYAGVATATEAAAFGVTGSVVIAMALGRFNVTVLREALTVTAATTAMIIFILIGAFVLQFVLAFLGIPAAMSNWIVSLGLNQFQVVLLVCVLYLVLGTFMEELSMIITTIPILVPLLKTLGVDLVWFGVIVVILVQAAIISPPVGMNLFILQSLRERLAGPGPKPPISDVFRGVMPFFLAMILTLALLVAVPDVALWLVKASRAV